jgi:flagellin FlaB
MRRRTLLRHGTAGLAAAAAFGLSGCAGDTADDNDEEDGDDEPTGTESRGTNVLDVVTGTGTVQDDRVVQVALTVKRAPDAGTIDLRETTVSWDGYTLAHDGVEADDDPDGRFRVDPVADSDGSAPVLNDDADRFTLVFDLGDATTEASEWESSAYPFGSPLEEGEVAEPDLTTGSGGTTTVRLVVPETLAGAESVNLGASTSTAGGSEETAVEQRTADQVADRLRVTSITGYVRDGEEITHVRVVVGRAPGSGEIDLRDVTASWVGPGGTFSLVHDGVETDTTTADGRFKTEPIQDEDGSAPVVNDAADRVALDFDLGDVTTDPGEWERDGFAFGDTLDEGVIVALNLTTGAGGTTTEQMVVPQTLSGVEVVNL